MRMPLVRGSASITGASDASSPPLPASTASGASRLAWLISGHTLAGALALLPLPGNGGLTGTRSDGDPAPNHDAGKPRMPLPPLWR